MEMLQDLRSILIFIRIVQFVLCENYPLNTSQIKNSRLKFSSSVSDSEERVLKRVVSVSIEKCKVECGYRPMCNSLVYQRQFLVCSLMSTQSETSIGKQSGYVLIMGINRHSENDVTSETKYNRTECEIADSVYDLDGNIYDIGSRVGFDGKNNGIGLYRVCEKNGQWSSIRRGSVPYGVQILSIAGDCSDVSGSSGIYWVPQTNRPIFCDMETDGGKWMVFQRREDGSVDFYRNWWNYTNGFGSVGGEFWMGLQPLYEIVAVAYYELRIDMVAFNGSMGYATYTDFTLGSPETNYILRTGGYSGNVGDGMAYHNLMPFSTFDRENHFSVYVNCAVFFKGAWWYNACHNSNLNGKYSDCGANCGYGVNIVWQKWLGFNATLIRTEMKIKRK